MFISRLLQISRRQEGYQTRMVINNHHHIHHNNNNIHKGRKIEENKVLVVHI